MYAPCCDPDDPNYDINDFEPGRDADDFCKLAHNQPHKARRQLNKAVALVRAANNRNRRYFDARQGSQQGAYIQLLRPWMKQANSDASAAWHVMQYQYHHAGYNAGERTIILIQNRQESAAYRIHIRHGHKADPYYGRHGYRIFSPKGEKGYEAVEVERVEGHGIERQVHRCRLEVEGNDGSEAWFAADEGQSLR